MVNLDYLYNPEAAKKILTRNHFVDKKLGFQVIEHGMIFPHKLYPCKGWNWGGGGVYDENGQFVKDSYESYGAASNYPRPAKEEIQHRSETVIYLNVFPSTWGNVLCENIARLWFFNSTLFQESFKDYRVVYIPFIGFDLFSKGNTNFRRLLEILEVDVNSLQAITQPTQFDKVIVPDKSLFSSDGYAKFTQQYRETIEQLRSFALKNRTPISNKKIYFFHGRRQIGEECIAEYFKSKGYEIISPEKLTIDEQLNCLINCESFASSMGSCSHNSVFLNDKTECILIPRAKQLFTPYQALLNQVSSLNVTYIDSTLSVLYSPIAGNPNNFLYIVSPQLKSFFGDKWNGYGEGDFKNFLQYVKDSLSKGVSVNPTSKSYYEPILKDFMEQLKRRKDLITAYDMPPGWEEFRMPLTYQTHVDQKGWSAWHYENQISNPLEDKLDIQAIKVNFPRQKVYCSVYYNEAEGWSPEVSTGEMAGTTGKGKSIYGIRIRFDEASAKEFDLLYRMHKFDGTWTPWAKNGEAIYSHGQKLSAIQIKLEPINSAETDTKKFDYTQTFWLKDDEIYLQGQRPQIN